MTRLLHSLSSLTVLALAVTLITAAPAEAKHGWSLAGHLVTAVGPGNAFALSDGRVVSVGMTGDDEDWDWPAATQTWSASSNAWTQAASKPALPNIYEAVAIMLDDGRILVTGLCRKDCAGASNTELYDPARDSWSMPGQMKAGRYLHAAVKLSDGRVLILGGCTTYHCVRGTTRVEVFDPRTDTFTQAAPMLVHRVCFTATLLADGRVLVAGGYNTEGVLADNETYDPASDRWTKNAPMKSPHVGQVAVLLHDERVLVAGGDCVPALPCSAADLFDPLIGKWKAAGPLLQPRDKFAGVTLKDGRVLVAGGLSYFGNLWKDLETAELFDPAHDKFVQAKSMAHQRGGLSLALLPDGRAMAVGGDAWLDEDPGTAELYTP
ncbi:MAG TPA: kelch repeat-containing protein [Rhizomicrobium sp.]|jgi:hypothetical protein